MREVRDGRVDECVLEEINIRYNVEKQEQFIYRQFGQHVSSRDCDDTGASSAQ